MEVFFSYSHVDNRYRKKLDTHLSTLKRQGLISNWSDHEITAGKTLDAEIAKHLDSAAIILLLISPEFIASEYCYTVELKRAIERHETGTARVIPVIARPCDWHSLPFGSLKAVPEDGKAITLWSPQDLAYQDISKKLRAVVNELSVAESGASKPSTVSPDSSASDSAEAVVLTAQLSVNHDVGLLQRIGCPCLALKLTCRSKSPAKIAGVRLHVRGPHILAAIQRAFSTNLGYTADEVQLVDEPSFYMGFLPASKLDTAHGFVIEQGDIRKFFIPAFNGSLLDFAEAPPQDVYLSVQHLDGRSETLLQGVEVQKELPSLLRMALDRKYHLHPAIVLPMGFCATSLQMPDIPTRTGFLNDQVLELPPHPRRDDPVDEESDRIRFRAKILRAGGAWRKVDARTG